MIMYFKRFILQVSMIAFLATASGCSVSEKTCLKNDWQTLGYKHGKEGQSADSLNRYVKDCAEYGVAPDASTYSAGYKVGIANYCTAENGFNEGRYGYTYSGACPLELEKPFLENYVDGLWLAMDELYLESNWDTLELNRLRAHRAAFASSEKYYVANDGRIGLLLGRISQNNHRRSIIYSNIRQWSDRI